MSEDTATYGEQSTASPHAAEPARLNALETIVRDIRKAIDQVRDWYDGDGEITNDAELVDAIVEDLQYDRAQSHLIQEILGCTGLEVMQTIKSLTETARIGGDARIAIGRLRADVQHSVNVGQPMTIEAILARLGAICEPTKATA